MITSLSNPKVLLVRNLVQNKKIRMHEGCYVAEGVRLVEEALRCQIQPQFLFYSPDLSDRGMAIIEAFQGVDVPVFDVSTEIMRNVSDTETSQGILGVFNNACRTFPLKPSFLLLVDGVRDPGNLGTLLRSAWAAGVEGVITTEGTVDLFSPKVVRAGMGAHFALPLWCATWEDVLKKIPPGPDLTYYATVVSNGTNVWHCDFTKPSIVIIGGEGDGVTAAGLTAAQIAVSIPMAAKTESLNAGIAGSLVLFEVLRQRLQGSER